MRLKRLELLGFKSFADRMVLNFDHALVGIVGPNGCGKSNVVDAVRWVLGEQRPKSMRGGEMIDVIFKGSASRPAMSVAEVTMILDNSSDVLENRGAEVSVTRRVYKSGEGEYLIDGERVRLKDVREMLFGTGLGSRGYSVLEQGRIDAVLSANAQERRGIFEEAAGISRYRQRKKETMSRLDRAQADVLRIEDLIRELERRQRSLKIQAGKAQRFVEFRDRWRVEGLRLASHQLHLLEGEIASVGREVSQQEENAEDYRQRRTASEEDVVSRVGEQEVLASDVDRLSGESADLAGEIRALDERRTQLAARVSAWRSASEEEGQRARELEAKLEEKQLELGQLDERIRGLEAELEGARTKSEEREGALGTGRVEHRVAHEEVDRQNEALLELLQQRTSLRNRVQHLEHAIEPLSERAQRMLQLVDGARQEAEAARLSESESRAELSRIDAEYEECDLERQEIEQRESVLRERSRDLQALRSELDLECARLQSRVESLLDWEREREGLEVGARGLLEHVENGRGPELGSELRGLLADHLRTETVHARALDAVLGQRTQSLVVQGAEDALRAVRWLKENELGRVWLAFPAAPGESTGERPAGSGVLGPLLEFTDVEPGAEELGRVLLQDVFVVEDVEVALRLVVQWPGLRFVTPAGDLIDGAGLLGGHVEVAQGAVGRRSYAAELEGDRQRRALDLGDATSELDGVGFALENLGRELVDVRTRLKERGEQRARARAANEALQARSVDLVRNMAVHEREREGVRAEEESTHAELEAARRELVAIEQEYEDSRREFEQLEERLEERTVALETLVADAGAARVETARLGEQMEAARRRRDDLARSATETEAELQRARRLRSQHAENARQGEVDAEELLASRDEYLAQRGELEERLQEMRQRERAGREAIELLRKRAEEITGELESLLASVAERRLECQKLELQHAEIGRRTASDFGVEPQEILVGFEPDPALADPSAHELLEQTVNELRTQLEKLGSVNIEAVEELQEVSERLEFLVAQKADLDESRRSLENTLQKLNQESERLFLDTFNEVRENFRTIFRQLFGGGKADLDLAEGEDVLEAGIEITARPPGRETLPITLLSGGQRTLTALALLFAIFRARPSPFCVLDEVDAALDDANIGRFLTMLTHSLHGTQFVIVTHNKGTMAACELLYGVTMQVRGVSHVVNVELSDVDEFVPEIRTPGKDGSSNGSSEAQVDLIPVAPPAPVREESEDPLGAGAVAGR